MEVKLLKVETDIIDRVGEKIDNRYVTFLLEYKKCYTCNRDMIGKPKYTGVFPQWIKLDFMAQAEKADLVIMSNVLVDDHFICVDCVQAGKANFLCALCEERKPTDKIQDWIGSPAEFLCTDCYNNVTAAIWDAKVHQLHEDHKYDGY